MRIVVTGSRYGDDERLVDWALSKVHRKHGITCLINGRCKLRGEDAGYDKLCREWAIRHDVPVEDYEADWSLGRRGGPIRNQRMIDEGRPDAAVSFPGGSGTADMVRRIKAAQLRHWELGISPATTD